MNRRRLLLVATGSLAAVGLLFAAYFFVANLAPAADKGIKVLDVSLSDIAPGTYKEVTWMYRPVAIFRPSPEVLDKLGKETTLTFHGRAIPTPAPPAFIYYLISTKLGCAVKHAPPGPRYPGDENWPGGFYDPCHYGEWDYAGRTLHRPSQPDDPLPDLQVPKYEMISSDVIRFHMRTTPTP